MNRQDNYKDIYCVDCDRIERQKMLFTFRDGSHTFEKYLCCECGCENDEEII